MTENIVYDRLIATVNSLQKKLSIPLNILSPSSILLLTFIINKKSILSRTEKRNMIATTTSGPLRGDNNRQKWLYLSNNNMMYDYIINDDKLCKLKLTKHALLLLFRNFDQLRGMNKITLNPDDLNKIIRIAFDHIYTIMSPFLTKETIKWVTTIRNSLQKDIQSPFILDNRELFELLTCSSSLHGIDCMNISGEIPKCCPFCHNLCQLKNKKGYVPVDCVQ